MNKDFTQTFEKVTNFIDHHCKQNICPECGDIATCRCLNPKTIITKNLCNMCKTNKNK